MKKKPIIPPPNGNSAAETSFTVQKIYTKDLSFESPNTPEVFKLNWEPVIDMHLTNEATPLTDDLFEVVLSLTLTVKVGEQTAYLTEVEQAGIFLIKNIPKSVVSRLLATSCLNILFPFARELIADLVMRGGFSQLLLAPVNFDALYMQQQEMENAKSEVKH